MVSLRNKKNYPSFIIKYSCYLELWDPIRETNTNSCVKKLQSRLQQMTFINTFHCFSEKIRLDVSSESSAGKRIHMKNQALFSSKHKSKQEDHDGPISLP